MGLDGPDTASDGPGRDDGPQNVFTAPANRTESRAYRTGWLVILAGLISGLLAFGLGELLYRHIQPARVPRDLMGTTIMVPTPETEAVAATKNGALAFGLLGLCLGASLGMAGGVARGSASFAVWGALFGALLSLPLGAGASLGLLPIFQDAQMDYPDHDLILALTEHSLVWGLLGALAGMAFAIGLGERRLLAPALIAGLAGAALGAIAFDLAGAMFFGLAETHKPISVTWLTRLMARLLVTLGTAAAVVLLVPTPKSHGTARQTPTEVPLPHES
jgi:hypothetical protein